MVTMTREQQNDLLRTNGYRWQKVDGLWKLFDPRGDLTGVDIALKQIENKQVPQPDVCFDERWSAIRWAQQMIWSKNSVVLDLETTGLSKFDRAIEIAIIDVQTAMVLMHTQIHTTMPISQKAYETHGISLLDLANAPPFEDVWIGLTPILEGKDIIAYNVSFDLRMLRQTAEQHGCHIIEAIKSHCLMRQYGLYAGIKISEREYKSHKLIEACKAMGIDHQGEHSSLGDALATRDLLIKMAAQC
jgi:DNA polymerase-3 subunit epsilon